MFLGVMSCSWRVVKLQIVHEDFLKAMQTAAVLPYHTIPQMQCDHSFPPTEANMFTSANGCLMRSDMVYSMGTEFLFPI